MEVNYLDLVGEGYMGSMQWQLRREMGTIPAFASRTQENQENLGRDGRNPGSSSVHFRISIVFRSVVSNNFVRLHV